MTASLFVTLCLTLGIGVLAVAFHASVRRNFIYAIPVIHQVADGLADVVAIGPVHTGFMRAGILLLFIAWWIPRLRATRANVAIYVFLTYLLVLMVTQASDPLHSLNGIVRIIVAMMMFPIAYSHFSSLEQLRKLHVGVIALICLITGYFIVAQVMRLGTTAYGEGAYLGLASVYVTSIACYALLLSPLIFRLLPRGRLLTRALFALSLVVGLLMMVLIFRRGSVLALGVGGTVYLMLSGNRARAARSLAVLAAGAMLSAPLWWQAAVEMAAFRGDIAGFVTDTSRGRMSEFGIVIYEFFTGGLRHSLFGTEVFNSRVYLGTERTLHVDYMNILLGTGLVGLIMYLVVWLAAAGSIIHWTRRRTDLPYVREIRASGLALVAAALTVGFSTQIWATGPLSFIFLNLGALAGFLSGGGRLADAPDRNAATRRPAARERRPNLALRGAR